MLKVMPMETSLNLDNNSSLDDNNQNLLLQIEGTKGLSPKAQEDLLSLNLNEIIEKGINKRIPLIRNNHPISILVTPEGSNMEENYSYDKLLLDNIKYKLIRIPEDKKIKLRLEPFLE